MYYCVTLIRKLTILLAKLAMFIGNMRAHETNNETITQCA